MNSKITDNLVIEYRNRKSLEIQIKPDGTVRVLAPSQAVHEWIMNAIEAKEKWIVDKLNKLSERSVDIPKLTQGARILDQGKYVRLCVGTESGLYPVQRVGEELHLNVIEEWKEKEDKLRTLLIDWYVTNTKNKVLEFTKQWAQYLNVNPKQLKIKDQKKRWGSCSSRGNLNFNWRLSMAPDSVLEYVVVHELCHFHHMDHSKDFWALVEQCLPDYQTKKAWLKEHGGSMFWLG